MTATAFLWDGEAMIPQRPKAADEIFVIGAVYWLVEEHQRSPKSLRHMHAWLHTAWLNLPEDLAPLYPSPEHLRKRALIEAGFYNEQAIDCGSKAAAERIAAVFQMREPFSMVVIRGSYVLVRTARSQSIHAMGGADFQASKAAVMEVVAALIGVTPDSLLKNAGAAA